MAGFYLLDTLNFISVDIGIDCDGGNIPNNLLCA